MDMRMITDIQIDLYGEEQLYLVSAKQGDRQTRYIRVQLMNNGNEFNIPEEVTLIANIQKPDGHFCYNECANEENRVMVELTNQALAAAGTAHCDIEMRSKSGELILSSASFTIEIEKSMRNEDAILSCNEMTVLDKKIQTYIDRMMATRQQILDTETAFRVAETARAQAETERILQEDARRQSEEQRTANETTRQQQLTRMQEATQKAAGAATEAQEAAEKAEELYKSEEELQATLEAQQKLYEQMLDMKGGIANIVSGGNPYSVDMMYCDGGTPYTTEECSVDCGNP